MGGSDHYSSAVVSVGSLADNIRAGSLTVKEILYKYFHIIYSNMKN